MTFRGQLSRSCREEVDSGAGGHQGSTRASRWSERSTKGSIVSPSSTRKPLQQKERCWRARRIPICHRGVQSVEACLCLDGSDHYKPRAHQKSVSPRVRPSKHQSTRCRHPRKFAPVCTPEPQCQCRRDLSSSTEEKRKASEREMSRQCFYVINYNNIVIIINTFIIFHI